MGTRGHWLCHSDINDGQEQAGVEVTVPLLCPSASLHVPIANAGGLHAGQEAVIPNIDAGPDQCYLLFPCL